MRVTITLDPDVEALVGRLMAERGMSSKQAVNHAIRLGLAGPARTFRTPTFGMGFAPELAWDKALRLAAELEDDELTRRPDDAPRSS